MVSIIATIISLIIGISAFIFSIYNFFDNRKHKKQTQLDSLELVHIKILQSLFDLSTAYSFVANMSKDSTLFDLSYKTSTSSKTVIPDSHLEGIKSDISNINLNIINDLPSLNEVINYCNKIHYDTLKDNEKDFKHTIHFRIRLVQTSIHQMVENINKKETYNFQKYYTSLKDNIGYSIVGLYELLLYYVEFIDYKQKNTNYIKSLELMPLIKNIKIIYKEYKNLSRKNRGKRL